MSRKKTVAKAEASVPATSVAVDAALPFVEIGASGLNYQGGYVYDEALPELVGLRGVKVYREMSRNDPVVGAMLFAIEMLLRQASWRVEPASQDLVDVAAADFVDSCREDMSQTWPDTISEILTMLSFGWAYSETVYKRRLGDSRDPRLRSRFDDGAVGWRKVALRAQETLFRWDFDEDGGIQAMEQLAPPDYTVRTVPIEKALLFRTKVDRNNPEGVSILRTAYTAWRYKHRIQNIEAVGIERDLAGLPVIYVDPALLAPTAAAPQRAALEAYKRLVTNIKRNEQEGVVLPMAYDQKGNRLYELTLLSTGGSRQFNTDPVITRYDQRIATSVLADFILLGQEKVGSFALSASKTRIFSLALAAWLDSIAAVFNRYAIPRLFALNAFPVKNLPRLTHGEVEAPNLAELADYVSKLAGAGVQLVDENVEAYLRQAAKLPERSEGL